MAETATIPFGSKQLQCSQQDRNRLLALEQQQIIRWTFTAFKPSASLGPLSDDEQALSYPMLLHCGPKGLALLPHLIAYLRHAGGWAKPYLRSAISKNRFGFGGAMVLIGRTQVPVEELDVLTTSELLIVPHLSASGPDGVWRIERGDLHPLVLAAGQLQVWTLANSVGLPDFYFHLAKGDPVDSSSARGVDLFTTLSGAQSWIEQGKEDGEPELIPIALTARELLSCLARVDVAAIDLKDFAVSHRGRVALGCNDIAASATLLEALAGKAA
ncbi:MAG: hypothetical protein IPH35_18060 [Rhodoferax sp.]|nr:hypothetical protein [Rhodoferax sp.]